MGCDIHCYIEYRQTSTNDWRDFGGRLNPGRAYRVFTRLAGVRGEGEQPIVAPRGMPVDAGWSANWDNRLYVVPENNDLEHSASRANAEKWVESGTAKWTDDSKKFVTHPDWHTHSWLTPDEWERAIGADAPDEYHAILASMRCFEQRGCDARVVFWFDN